MHFIGGLLCRICHATFVYRTQSQKGNKKKAAGKWAWKGPSLYYVSKSIGWVGLENASLADAQSCIYSNRVGEWCRKSPKICWHNIGMVPKASELERGWWLFCIVDTIEGRFFCCWIWIHHPWLEPALLLHITDIKTDASCLNCISMCQHFSSFKALNLKHFLYTANIYIGNTMKPSIQV